MVTYKDLTGQKFGMLTAIKVVEHCGKHKPVKWRCKCDCGNEVIFNSQRLQANKYVKLHCGCYDKTYLLGKRFGLLTVTKYIGYRDDVKDNKIYWECKCDCGKTTYVTASRLTSKKNPVKSCGCASRTKHNLSNSRLYTSYLCMKERCYNENHKCYSNYGGRGITICDQWLGENGFINFSSWALSNGYEDGLTIDRKDNDKGYSPDNCKWSTRKEQMRNLRSNRVIEINGESKILTDWCIEKGISQGTVYDRVRRGWSFQEAITIPVGKKRGTD